MNGKTRKKQTSPLLIVGVLLICVGLIGLSVWFLITNLVGIGTDDSETLQHMTQETERPIAENAPDDEKNADDEPIKMDIDILETLPGANESEEKPAVGEESPAKEETTIPDEEKPEFDVGYLLDSDNRLLTEEDVRHLTLQQLNYARNEIYARHGRRFKSAELQRYFDSQPWYQGTIEPADFDESVLSKLEKANIEFLKKYERSIDPNGYQLDAET